MRPGRIVALVFGCIAALIGIVMVFGSVAAGIAVATQRDDDGFFDSDTVRIESPTAAMRSDEIDLGSDEHPRRWPFGDGDLATVRIIAEPPEGDEIFVGIAHTTDVDAYLGDVRHDVVRDIDWGDDEVRYRRVGSETALSLEPPVDQDFWSASASGSGEQTLTWDVQGGNWSIVAMRPDGQPRVAADFQIGVKIDALVWLIVGLGIAGLVLLAIAVALIIWSTRDRQPAAAAEVPAGDVPSVPSARSPVSVNAGLDEPLSRGLWLVKWFLAIPHWIVLVFLWIGFFVVSIIAFFAILFTARYPRSLFRYSVGVLRWTWRVTYYATSAIGTDRYPPFTLAPTDYPAKLEIEYPERLSRGLVLVKWWLLAIPHYIIVGFFVGGGWYARGRSDEWSSAGGPGLIGWVTIFAGVALLFTGRYPRGLFDFVVGMNRWVYRVVAYAALMTDRYPPFVFDAGPTEPSNGSLTEPATRPPAEPRAEPAAEIERPWPPPPPSATL